MAFMLTSSLILGCLLLVLVKLTRHFGSPQQLPLTAHWIDELSIENYRPMLCLLDEEELKFLRAQPGFTPKSARKFRTQRYRVFQVYLRRLDDDSKRICSALKVVMGQSRRHDRPDPGSALIWSQTRFAYGMMVAQVKLACYRYGIGTGTVKAYGLLELFDGMRTQLRTRVPAEST
jgi:hypothetical protein